MEQKPPQNQRNVVLLKYSQGGLDITNVYSYCKSVKFMWIKKQWWTIPLTAPGKM